VTPTPDTPVIPAPSTPAPAADSAVLAKLDAIHAGVQELLTIAKAALQRQ
jgi:hypothetical protein